MHFQDRQDASRQLAEKLLPYRDERGVIYALDIPRWYLGAVGAYYAHFDQVSDDEVVALLRDAQSARVS